MPTEAELGQLSFVSRPDFHRPLGKVGLAGSASRESADPVFFHDGVLADRCDDVLELEDNVSEPKKSYSVGIICRMSNGGRLALLGTEFADIAGSGGDIDIAKKWFRDMRIKRVER